jgi:hypothetical protein
MTKRVKPNRLAWESNCLPAIIWLSVVLIPPISLVADYEFDLDTSTTNYWASLGIARPSKPAYMGWFIDSIHGNKLIRITGDVGESIPNVPGKFWGDLHKHGYSNRGAFNCDSTYLLLEKGGHYIVDLSNYSIVKRLSPPIGQRRWHHQKADTMQFFTADGAQCGEYNVLDDSISGVFSVDGFTDLTLEGNGNWTHDAKRVAALGVSTDTGNRNIVIIDFESRQIVATIDISSDFEDAMTCGSVGISPLGNYVIVVGKLANGQTGNNPTGSDRHICYSVSSGAITYRSTLYGLPSHADLGLDVNGDEVYVGGAKSNWPAAGIVAGSSTVKRKCADGTLSLVARIQPSHTSCRNIKRPGWAYLSAQSKAAMYSGNLPWYTGEVIAVKLDGTRHERCGIMYGADKDIYDHEHHACPSPDGKLIAFGSQWDKQDGDPGHCVQGYISDISEFIIFPGVDADLDGMHDQWETKYFGGTNAANGGAADDWDHDGILNVDEYVAGTSPINNEDRLIMGIKSVGGCIVVKYSTLSATGLFYEGKSRFYDLEKSTNLVSGYWVPIIGETNIPGSDTTLFVTNESLLDAQYFRVKARLE